MRFCILRDALRWSAPQDEVHYSKDLPHPEEAPIETPPAAAPQDRRAVSKGFETRVADRAVGIPSSAEACPWLEQAAGVSEAYPGWGPPDRKLL